jgi:hypothetical protein
VSQGDEYAGYDDGIVVGSKFDLEQEQPWTFRWIPKDKTHPAYEKLSYIRIAPVNSNDGQKMIKSSFPAGFPPGYFCLDEKGICISDPNDNRLHSKDYFVVPVDLHL